jgi:hypothetical protein
MKNIIKISIIFSSVLILIVWFTNPIIEVRKQVEKGFRLPEKVLIKLTNDEDSSIDAPPGHMAMSFFIDEAINAIGIEKSYDGKADIILKCNYKYGLCLPYFGRHFDIHFTAISDVNLKFLDQSNEVLAESQFFGSWNRMPTSELIAKMIGLIIQTEIHLPSSSINHEDINSVVVKYTTN